MLLERLFESSPLIYPHCSREMRIIALVTHANAVQRMLTHIGEPIHRPVIAPARASPSGDDQLEPTPSWDEWTARARILVRSADQLTPTLTVCLWQAQYQDRSMRVTCFWRVASEERLNMRLSSRTPLSLPFCMVPGQLVAPALAITGVSYGSRLSCCP